MGAIASFPNFPALEKGFEKVAELLPKFNPEEFGDAQPPNVLNMALRVFEPEDDMSESAWSDKIIKLVNERRATLVYHGIRRVSVIICRQGQYPLYYTLRDMGESWGEEQAIRNIEPALAYQLELSRLSNYNLTPVFVENKSIHIYHGIARENQLDSRFFVRALVRPGRIKGSINTAEYLISETDRLVTSILDALEVVSAKYRNADCNHISMNFIHCDWDIPSILAACC